MRKRKLKDLDYIQPSEGDDEELNQGDDQDLHRTEEEVCGSIPGDGTSEIVDSQTKRRRIVKGNREVGPALEMVIIEDILFLVGTFLSHSVRDLIQLSSVCKRWNLLMNGSSFLDIWKRAFFYIHPNLAYTTLNCPKEQYTLDYRLFCLAWSRNQSDLRKRCKLRYPERFTPFPFIEDEEDYPIDVDVSLSHQCDPSYFILHSATSQKIFQKKGPYIRLIGLSDPDMNELLSNVTTRFVAVVKEKDQSMHVSLNNLNTYETIDTIEIPGSCSFVKLFVISDEFIILGICDKSRMTRVHVLRINNQKLSHQSTVWDSITNTYTECKIQFICSPYSLFGTNSDLRLFRPRIIFNNREEDFRLFSMDGKLEKVFHIHDAKVQVIQNNGDIIYKKKGNLYVANVFSHQSEHVLLLKPNMSIITDVTQCQSSFIIRSQERVYLYDATVRKVLFDCRKSEGNVIYGDDQFFCFVSEEKQKLYLYKKDQIQNNMKIVRKTRSARFKLLNEVYCMTLLAQRNVESEGLNMVTRNLDFIIGTIISDFVSEPFKTGEMVWVKKGSKYQCGIIKKIEEVEQDHYLDNYYQIQVEPFNESGTKKRNIHITKDMEKQDESIVPLCKFAFPDRFNILHPTRYPIPSKAQEAFQSFF